VSSAEPLRAAPLRAALVGFMGCGKTAVGRRLAARLKTAWHDTDDIIAHESGMGVVRFFAERGEAAFRAAERELLRRLAADGAMVLSCGGGIVLDEGNRARLRDDFVTVWLRVSAENVIARIESGSRPLLACEDPLGRARELLERRAPLYAEASRFSVDTDREGPERIAELIHDMLHTKI
jgi:shikimate kinase